MAKNASMKIFDNIKMEYYEVRNQMPLEKRLEVKVDLLDDYVTPPHLQHDLYERSNMAYYAYVMLSTSAHTGKILQSQH